jgi:hypothetical protein
LEVILNFLPILNAFRGLQVLDEFNYERISNLFELLERLRDLWLLVEAILVDVIDFVDNIACKFAYVESGSLVSALEHYVQEMLAAICQIVFLEELQDD